MGEGGSLARIGVGRVAKNITVFRGATKVTLDAKGRLAIPTRYRERIAARCDGQLVATVDRDHCVLIYPLQDWEDIERKLMRLPSLNEKARRLQRLMVGYATELELDGSGRILVSRELRDFASLERTAMLIGQGNKFELWDEATWNEKRDEWLREDDDGVLPAELESLSL
nr:division/cell wall cluster transcriptional repressor MraZ [Woeseia oceani]